MIVRVYPEDEAFAMVRLFAGSFVAGITSGISDTKRLSTATAIVVAISANDHRSAPRRLLRYDPINATAATADRMPDHTVPYASVVHTKNPAATTIVSNPERTASARAR